MLLRESPHIPKAPDYRPAMSHTPASTLSRRSLVLGGVGLERTRHCRRVRAATDDQAIKPFSLTPRRGAFRSSAHLTATPMSGATAENPGSGKSACARRSVRIMVEKRLAGGHDRALARHTAAERMDACQVLLSRPSNQATSSSTSSRRPMRGRSGITRMRQPSATRARTGGALIIEEPDPILVDRDIIWMLVDWRLTRDAQVAPDSAMPMDAGMAGRIGNTVTLNGAVSEAVSVRRRARASASDQQRSARIMALRFEGHRP